MDTDTPRCTACGRNLWDDELSHFGCGVCLRATDRRLAELAGPPVWRGHKGESKLVSGYYAALGDALAPGAGSGGDGRVTGSRTAPLPIRLEPLSLAARGGVVTVLQTWLSDFHDQLGWLHPRFEGDMQGQLDQVVTRLRANLPWAAEHHPAWAELVTEVRQAHAACRAQTTGERPERRVRVCCPCGVTLSITLSTQGQQCGGCSTSYTWAELRELPLAERSAA
jgi:hypothetical protein